MNRSLALRFGALLLALLLICGTASAATVKSGESIFGESVWINSDIAGAVDENTRVSLRDDFHTAVNRDWILYEEDRQGGFEKSEALLYQRKLDIALGRTAIDPANADAVGLGRRLLEHDLALIEGLAELAGNWEARNALGAEPARPYLEAIASIATMEEMTAYLTNANGMNITGYSMLDMSLAPDPGDGKIRTVTVAPNKKFSLSNQDQYLCITGEGRTRRYITDAAMHYLLGRLGYDGQEIGGMLSRGYRFEGRMAEHIGNSMWQQSVPYMSSSRMLSLEEAAAMAGRYPLEAVLASRGAAGPESINVYEEAFLRGLDRLYQPQYLEEMKAVCMMHTVRELIGLLDEEANEKLKEIILEADPGAGVPSMARIMWEVSATEEELRMDVVYRDYLDVYLPEVMDQLYVAAHCTPALKAEILEIIDQTVLYYREMITNVDWLSREAREATVEKLDSMAIRCVYPDRFTDYSGLRFSGYGDETPGTLPQAVAATERFSQERLLAGAGTEVDRSEWKMDTPMTSTTVCNAYYAMTENTINIMAGILTEEMYRTDWPYEKKLAVIGTVIGHEITHAFDTTGYQFDKNGKNNPWWSLEDKYAFDLRANKLIKYYNSIIPYPGALLYMGDQVAGEAIADMGGVKCMLSIAGKIPDFDYEIFFRSYAELWRVQRSLEAEKNLASNDVHPLNYLRTNVTLQQFDEFQETFGIRPGDDMYVAPQDRINVW